MPILSAEIQFRKGLAALADGDAATAEEHFQSAIQIERQRGAERPQMRYLSFHGLSTALAHGATAEAIRACEVAARRDSHNADLHCNLGRVYLLGGKATLALAAFERGLEAAPTHPGLRAEIRKVDRRSAPALSFLSRDHPLNTLLGRLRASLPSRGSRARAAARRASSEPA